MTPLRPIRPILAALALLGLAACGDDQESLEATGGAASGEVLEGTISDEMIPLDVLRSQPPLLSEEEAAELTEE